MANAQETLRETERSLAEVQRLYVAKETECAKLASEMALLRRQHSMVCEALLREESRVTEMMEKAVTLASFRFMTVDRESQEESFRNALR